MTTFNRVTDKRVSLALLRVDGNIFAVFGAFRQQAKREGWTDEEISAVFNQAKDADYDFALWTIMQYCVNDGTGPDVQQEQADWEAEAYGEGHQYE